MDKYIVGGNSSGKTRKMLEEAKKNNAVVICKNPFAMTIKARNYGIFGLNIVGYGDIDSVDSDKIAIDELGEFFKYNYGMTLDSFTMTVD